MGVWRGVTRAVLNAIVMGCETRSTLKVFRARRTAQDRGQRTWRRLGAKGRKKEVPCPGGSGQGPGSGVVHAECGSSPLAEQLTAIPHGDTHAEKQGLTRALGFH